MFLIRWKCKHETVKQTKQVRKAINVSKAHCFHFKLVTNHKSHNLKSLIVKKR